MRPVDHLRKGTLSFSTSGYVYGTIAYDDKCNTPILGAGFPVNYCFVADEFSYKVQIVGGVDSCEGAIFQYYSDVQCTHLLGTSELSDGDISCEEFAPMLGSDKTYVQFFCTNGATPKLSHQANIVGMTQSAVPSTHPTMFSLSALDITKLVVMVGSAVPQTPLSSAFLHFVAATADVVIDLTVETSNTARVSTTLSMQALASLLHKTVNTGVFRAKRSHHYASAKGDSGLEATSSHSANAAPMNQSSNKSSGHGLTMAGEVVVALAVFVAMMLGAALVYYLCTRNRLTAAAD